jgi:hypothetical protein
MTSSTASTTIGAPTTSITIRPAYADDEAALRRLAALDSAAVPPMPLLIAEIDGEPRAALSLRDRSMIADPFVPTLHVLELLALHAAATDTPRRIGRSWRRPSVKRLVPRLS